MRIKVNLIIKDGNLVLPINYQHIIQGWIYSSLDNYKLASELHEHTSFKHFNYSDIFGKFVVDGKKKTITFSDKISIYISSDDLYFMGSLICYLFKNPHVEFIKQSLLIDNIVEEKEYAKHDSVKIRMLSPLTIHTTDEFKQTEYYLLDSEEFLYLINQNAKKKLGIECEENILHLSSFNKINKIVVPYKGFIIVGYKFEAILSMEKENINKLLDVGLGDKNSMGFGMFKIIN